MKSLLGTITSLKNPKTAQVSVMTQRVHPIYKKAIQKTKTIAVHYENITVKEGNKVVIVETRPISKTKHFKILKVI